MTAPLSAIVTAVGSLSVKLKLSLAFLQTTRTDLYQDQLFFSLYTNDCTLTKVIVKHLQFADTTAIVIENRDSGEFPQHPNVDNLDAGSTFLRTLDDHHTLTLTRSEFIYVH